MKRIGIDGGFLLCLAINLIANLPWTIPAWIALVLYFAIGIPITWFLGFLALWFVIILVITLVLSFIVSIPSPKQNVLTPEEKEERNKRFDEISKGVGKKTLPKNNKE